MAYVVKVNGTVIGVQILTVEEVKKYNNNPEITIKKVVK